MATNNPLEKNAKNPQWGFFLFFFHWLQYGSDNQKPKKNVMKVSCGTDTSSYRYVRTHLKTSMDFCRG